MKRVGRSLFLIDFIWGGGCLAASLFILPQASADTILLKNEKAIKGLVVEKHADRIILSTEKGEIPILLTGIKNIQYDDPEQNFMQIGRGYEAEGKYGEALAYYEKALEANPDFDEAKKAAAAMKSRFWAATTEGPQSEMDKQQIIYDSWGQGRSLDAVVKKQSMEDEKILRDSLGLALDKKGDWVYVREARPRSDAALAGLKRGDRLIAVDAESLRYLGSGAVVKKMIQPRYSSFTLEYERICRVFTERKSEFSHPLGLKLMLNNLGVSVEKVDAESPAAEAGLKEGDLISAIDGRSTRYLPLGKVLGILKKTDKGSVALWIRRSAMLTRR